MTQRPDRIPNLFLIGAQKGGSTNLADHLNQSPDIAYFGQKEPNIFSRGSAAAAVKRMNDFGDVEPGLKYILDGSPDYSHRTAIGGVPELIKRFSDDYSSVPSFIYTLRDPVERLISHYFWSQQRYGEARTLEDAIISDARYVERSRYDLQIEAYAKLFPLERFYFVKFEEYIASPLENLRKLLKWLGAREPENFEPYPDFVAATDKEVTRKARIPGVNRFVRSNPLVRNFVRKVVPPEQQLKINAMLSREAPRPEVSEEFRAEIRDRYFLDSIQRTQELTGLDLSDWLAPASEARVGSSLRA